MQLSSLTQRISGPSVNVWVVHYEAARRLANGEDIYLLSVGQESYETTSQTIVDAAIKSLQSGRHHYTPVEGELHIRERIARQHKSRTGQNIGAENLHIICWSSECTLRLCSMYVGTWR